MGVAEKPDSERLALIEAGNKKRDDTLDETLAELKRMPKLIGEVVENKIAEFEKREAIHRQYEDKWKMDVENRLRVSDEKHTTHELWKQGVKSSATTAVAVMTGVATFLSWLLDKLIS
jgi:hypothetical protein